MAISAIQPITNFSTILPATSVSPPELLSVAADFVTTANAQAVVTLGEVEPVTTPVLDSTGQPLSPGRTAQTPQSQALADRLTTGLNFLTGLNSTMTFITINNFAVSNAQFGTSNLNLALLALEMNLLNAGNLSTTGSTADFSGVLSSSVQLAIARIGTGNANTAGVVTPNGITADTGVNALLGTPTAATTLPTTTTTTATPTTATVPAATVAPATVPTATAPTVTPPPAIAPAAIAPAVGVPVATVPVATAPPALTVPTVGTTAATGTPTSAAPTAAEALQRLVADVTGRAVANLLDPGFASTSANLFVAAAVVRANSGTAPTGMGTADIAGNPPPEVTALQPARTV